MFVLQNAPDAAPALEGVQASRLPLAGRQRQVRSDADRCAKRRPACTRSWEYSTDLFDAATIERMAQHFETLLEGIVADADQRIGELPLLTESERHQLLVEWNDTAADYPQDRCIHQLFEEQVARTPDAVAVVFEDERLTYGELERARQPAGASPASVWGLGPRCVVGALPGALARDGRRAAGDPQGGRRLSAAGSGLPIEAARLHAGGCRGAGAGDALGAGGAAPFPQVRSVLVDADAAAIAAQPTSAPALALDPQHPAYVIYTSGSTGTPKGVAMAHGHQQPRRVEHECDTQRARHGGRAVCSHQL